MVIELSERLTIAEASALRDRFEAEIVPGEGVRIDASKVAEVDTAGLQLLLSVARTEGAIGWVGVSEALRGAARLIGLDGPLGLAAGSPV